MRILAGTSGYSYKEWKGSFYPQRCPAGAMLQFYAVRFPTVEINNTFYRLPKISVIESWVAQVPGDFRFAVKAPRLITHIKRLEDSSGAMDALLEAMRALGSRLGVLLFQLPPYFEKDLARLEKFLDLLPRDASAAFEFRHSSWLHEEVYARLRTRNIALCLTDSDETAADSTLRTANWGYARLRRAHYSDAELTAWLARLRATEWSQAFVFFKHEDTGTGPRFATRLLELAAK